MSKIELYKNYLDKAISYYHSDDLFIKHYNSVPKSRYYSFKFCLDYFKDKNINILELGTSRSFVDGRFEGCNSDDIKYWEPNNMEKWDWSAGCFTRVFATCLPNSNITTLDLSKNHIQRCQFMNKDLSNINYIVSSSTCYLKNYKGPKLDLIYLDTGDMTPINPTAELQLEEAKLIVQNNLLNKDGLLLIDDVRNPTPLINGEISKYGKAKYSIPYLLNNGFEIVFNEYQVIMKKN